MCTNNPAKTPTWHSSLCSLQAWPSSTDLMSPTLSQGADGKLEGTARHMHAIVLHTHSVHTRLGGHKANAVRVVFSLHNVRFVNLARRAGHLSRHVCYADLCRNRQLINFILEDENMSFQML